MWPNPQETADLVTFTEEIFNGKLDFFVQCDCNFVKHIKIGIYINLHLGASRKYFKELSDSSSTETYAWNKGFQSLRAIVYWRDFFIKQLQINLLKKTAGLIFVTTSKANTQQSINELMLATFFDKSRNIGRN